MTNVVPIRPAEGATLPVVLGRINIGRCYRCGRTVVPATYHVEVEVEGGIGVVCRYCADVDPDLEIWGEYCDVTDAIDRLMRDAVGRDQRLLLASMLAGVADHFACWRWDEPDQPSGDGDA